MRERESNRARERLEIYLLDVCGVFKQAFPQALFLLYLKTKHNRMQATLALQINMSTEMQSERAVFLCTLHCWLSLGLNHRALDQLLFSPKKAYKLIQYLVDLRWKI